MQDWDWLERIYRQHKQQLFLTAWNVLRCPSMAEDAVHAAILRLSERSVPPVDPKLYAFRAVRNAAIDLSRSRSRRQAARFPIDEQSEPAAFPIDDESLAAAQAALLQLDEGDREVVELHLHGRLTFHEIATICEEPLQTVASRFRRAIEKLRKMLDVYCE